MKMNSPLPLSRGNGWLIIFASILAAACLLHTPGAWAYVASQGVLDTVQQQFKDAASYWEATLMNAAVWLFWTLGAISLTWTMGMLALRKADIQEFFAEFVRFIIFFGFFKWLLENAPTFGRDIITALQKLGYKAAEDAANATGTALHQIQPSSIVDIGFDIWHQASNAPDSGFTDRMTLYILAGIILVVLAIIAINYLLVLVSGWIIIYAGIFLLGFGGSRWTSDIAINYYKTVLGVALQLLVMILLIGIAQALMQGFMHDLQGHNARWQEYGAVLVAALALMMLTDKVPSMVSGLITGSSIGGGGIGSFGAGAAVGAAAMAAGSMARAASSAGKIPARAMNVAYGLQGARSAMLAAQEVASGRIGASVIKGLNEAAIGITPLAAAAGLSGMSGGQTALTTAKGAVSGSGVKGATKSGEASNRAAAGDAGGFSATFETTDGQAQQATSAARELGKGMRAALKAHMDQKISQTAGGRLASAIRESADRYSEQAPDGGKPTAGGVLGQAIREGIRAHMQGKIADTTGGRVADAIRAGVRHEAGQMPEANARTTSGNPGITTIEQADPDSEVSAFRDRE